MSNEGNSQSRRNFIKRSGGFIGALGVGSGAGANLANAATGTNNEVETRCSTDLRCPIEDYPWNVSSDNYGQTTLFLLHEYEPKKPPSLNKIIYKPFSKIIEHMTKRIKNAKDSDLAKIKLRLDDGYTIESLTKSLEDVRAAMGTDTSSYYELALKNHSSWPSGLNTELDTLRKHILMSLNPNHRTRIELFRKIEKGELQKALKGSSSYFSLYDLFCSPKSRFQNHCKGNSSDHRRSREREAIQHARDCGLLWCRPRGMYEIPEDEIVNSLGKVSTLDPNQLKCSYNASEGKWTCVPTSIPDEYCQIVDDECNGMST